ncbi:Putative cytochrome c family protein [Bradyrhizobium sp. ORS 278]|uniref:c-type cytochrome n=1 Tax=Bradyrhizobium sp. (strain ORS 278) TaxID=114615 RepID=UPI0001508EE6|nr:c-type cytochrome [Bradyrhizobium sp. ORS 278]CAL79925.1 Putative cytochrome c family protein [Bradyrhizobium sp. ORS 278]
MLANWLKRTAPAVVLVIGCGSGQAAEGGSVSKAELDAKVTYCKTCHGLQAEGFRGSYPMPRLAGQQPEYIENQLRAFNERRRTNPIMFNVAHSLSPDILKALTSYFLNLNPKPLGGGDKTRIAAGRQIFTDGVLSAEVPACATCHGADGKGSGAVPRLAGQLPDYILTKLTNWSKERGLDKTKPDSSEIMAPIAHNLTEVQIKQVAAYVSTLE